MRRLLIADLPSSPWRNGGGTTTLLAAQPDGASFDHCLWRVDLSDIDRAGPFSHLPGLDRTILPLSAGLVLTVDGARSELGTTDPFGFSGDSVTNCEITAPMRALNVFTRRGLATATVTSRRGAGRMDGPGTMVLCVFEGAFVVDHSRGGADLFEAGAVAVFSGGPVVLRPAADGSSAVAVLIRCWDQRPSNILQT